MPMVGQDDDSASTRLPNAVADAITKRSSALERMQMPAIARRWRQAPLLDGASSAACLRMGT